jgi:hypothetical protein
VVELNIERCWSLADLYGPVEAVSGVVLAGVPCVVVVAAELTCVDELVPQAPSSTLLRRTTARGTRHPLSRFGLPPLVLLIYPSVTRWSSDNNKFYLSNLSTIHTTSAQVVPYYSSK